MYRLFVKRLLDIVLSAMGIVIFSPVYLLIGLMVRIQMGAPVLFSQERIGKDEKPFRLYKFRSMTNEKDAQGQYLPEEQRMTKFGKLLRSSSLDELPELYGEEFRTYELTITLEAGKHVIAVTTSEDFNRDANAGDVVKSVNADYVEVIFVKEVEIETEAEVVATAKEAAEVAEAPKTADFAISAVVLLVSAGAAYVVSKKR